MFAAITIIASAVVVVVMAATVIITLFFSYLFDALSLVSSQPLLSLLQIPEYMCVLGPLLFFLFWEGSATQSDPPM